MKATEKAKEALQKIIDRSEKHIRESSHHKCDYFDTVMSNYEMAKNALSALESESVVKENLTDEKEAEDAMDVAYKIIARMGRTPFFKEDIGRSIQRYAESYHAKNCAECKKDRRISVNERLPQLDEYVLWIHENGFIFYDAIDKDWDNKYMEYFLGGYGRKERCGRITHWMKPEAPKE
jgi:hypothetical protein